MTRKKIIISLSLLTALIILAVLAWYLLALKHLAAPNIENEGKAPLNSSGFYEPQPIPLEYMKAEEKAKFNLDTRENNRLQVLSRDADGNVSAYRIIYTDSDILTEY